MKILIAGKVENVSEKIFEGKIKFVYQFLQSTKSGLKLISVSSEKDQKFLVGEEIEAEISLSFYNNNIYYKFI